MSDARVRQWVGAARLRPAGHLACLAFALTTSPLAEGGRLMIVAISILALVTSFERRGLRILIDWRLWAALAAIVVPTALLGTDSTSAMTADWSGGRWAAGGRMALRAGSMVLALAGFASSVSVSELGAMFERVGLKGLGFALGVAVNALPTLGGMATTTYQAIRLRGGFRRRRLEAWRLWLVTVVTGSLVHAEEIVSAAEARAFAVDCPRRLPVLGGWPDGLLAAALVAAAVAIIGG